MKFKRDEIVFLIGAGASMDAGLPDSKTMIEYVEDSLTDGWSQYKPLYDFVKSSILYGDGVSGDFNWHNYNIERLVNTLDELRKKEDHPLYPFVGSWSPKLNEVTDQKFKNIKDFRSEIVNALRSDWIELENENDANYFKKFEQFRDEYEHPLRIFTLNYDLCIEKSCDDIEIQRGFDEERKWDWRLFEDNVDEEVGIFLYKLHGSTDWQRHPEKTLTYSDSTSAVKDEDVAMIFGTAYKLQYIDPFLFFAYEFRKWTLDSSRIIVCIGYGFGDEHINGILKQALENNSDRKLLSVNPGENHKELIIDELDLESDNQIICESYQAKEYFKNQLTLNSLEKHFPEDEAADVF